MSGLGVRARLRVLGLLWWSGSEGSEGLSMHTTVSSPDANTPEGGGDL